MAWEHLQSVVHRLKLAVTRPIDELDRWDKAARFAHDLGKYGARQLQRDRAPQMAGALAFRTLFGLLPVLVMAAIVVRALRGPEAFVEIVSRLVRAAGLYDVGDAQSSLGLFIEDMVKQAAAYNTAAIGWIGLAVLVYAATSLMVTIENSFNVVFRAPEGRSWTTRFPMYTFVLMFGPIAMGITFYFNSKVESWIVSFEAWQWLLTTAALLWTFTITWLLMLAVYTLIPNTTIRVRPAMIGAFVATILLMAGKSVLGAYLSNALSVTQFGGSLGLIPLFMLWVYVMWLVILFGLQVSATLQMLAGRTLEEMDQKRAPTGLVDPASILIVMGVVAERFRSAKPTTARQIVDATGIAEATVATMLNRLAEAGILHRVEGDDRAVTMARPPEGLPAAEVIEIGFALVDESGPGRPPALLERLRTAQRTLAAQETLAQLLPPQAVVASPDQVRGH